MIVESFLQYVDDIMLEVVEIEGDYTIRVFNITDEELLDCPVSKVEFFTKLAEGFSGRMDVIAVEYIQRGLSVQESLDLRQTFHV